MEEQKIILISYGQFEKAFLDDVGTAVYRAYHYHVSLEESRLDLNPFYNPGRRQYDGNLLLEQVGLFPTEGSFRKVGLFKADLFIPILTYIFGQAVLNGNAAVASTYRLRNELYGLKKDDRLLLERFRKEIIHELGHAFGLIHCHIPGCVMRSSTYVEDIDQKSESLCEKCRTMLRP